MRFVSLASGSNGNSTYIGTEKTHILVDAGCSRKKILEGLNFLELDFSDVSGIFVTHEHSDHVKGLRVFAKKFGIKVYASKGTISELENKNILSKEIEYEVIEKSGINIDNINIIPFETSHDCTQGYGYTFFIKKQKFHFVLI